MASDRYALLGLARPRQPWFRQVARWSTTASIPADFGMCLSAEEVVTRLDSARQFSALLVDSAVIGIDRDLIAHANAVGCPVIVVDDGRGTRDWEGLGAAAILRGAVSRAAGSGGSDGTGDRSDDTGERHGTGASPIARAQLLAVLGEVAQKVASVDGTKRGPATADPTADATERGRLVAVTGPRGHGTSITAMAIAQGLAARSDRLLLADLALDANLALLHDSGDVVPSVQELVEAFRLGAPNALELTQFTVEVASRHYRLLMGLRRHRDWTGIRPRAFDAALDGLLRGHHLVVADIEADFEGRNECGSADVEERNLFARRVSRAADLVVVVSHGTFSGLHGMLRVIDDLLSLGVSPSRIQPVINRTHRNPRVRAELSASLADLTRDRATLSNPIFLPERRRLDDTLHAGDPLPAALVSPLTATVEATLLSLPAKTSDGPEAERIPPGAFGRWTESMAS